MLDKKDSARLTMGLNYWNFCTASFLPYCLPRPTPSLILTKKFNRAKQKINGGKQNDFLKQIEVLPISKFY